MSLLLRPDSDEKFLKITMASAVAVSEAVDDNFGIKTGIKWVNDIFYNNRKISGTVAEAHNVGEPDRYVILGIGVNIYRNTSVPDDISGIYGSIKDTVCDLSKEEQVRSASALSSAITDRFGIYYDDPVRSGLIDRYRARSMVIGCDVYYMCGDIELPAHVVGIDDDGGIMLDMNGEVRVYRDGEIRIRLSDM